MSSVNKVILLGRLGKDPEVVSMNDGKKIVKFSIATSESWKDKNSGERRERTEWANVVIFNEKLGEIANQYLRKGDQCYLEGKMQTRKWSGQDGTDRYTTEVVLQAYRGELTLLGGNSKKDGAGNAAGEHYAKKARENQESRDDSDDIPF